MERLRIGPHGELRLAKQQLQALDLQPGSYVTVRVEKRRIVIEKSAFDPLADFGKKPDADALEKAIDQERDRARKADRTFEKLMENPPEVRPEDRPDFWD
jgi:hypothetical protein